MSKNRAASIRARVKNRSDAAKQDLAREQTLVWRNLTKAAGIVLE